MPAARLTVPTTGGGQSEGGCSKWSNAWVVPAVVTRPASVHARVSWPCDAITCPAAGARLSADESGDGGGVVRAPNARATAAGAPASCFRPLAPFQRAPFITTPMETTAALPYGGCRWGDKLPGNGQTRTADPWQLDACRLRVRHRGCCAAQINAVSMLVLMNYVSKGREVESER